MNKTILKVAALCVHLYIMCHGYRGWSAIYRAVWCRKYRNVPLPRLTLEQAEAAMRYFQWRADGPRTLGDAVATPQAVQARGFDPKITDDNDCDEEGIYLANTVEDPRVEKAELMTVSWWSPKDGFAGHNVCLLTQLGCVRYMDYRAPQTIRLTELDVARDVVRDYTGGTGILLCWHVSSKDLVPLRGAVVV